MFEAKQKILVAVDAVVFTVKSNELYVLLIKRRNPPFKGQYALPGGFVVDNESLEKAALRELEEETGVKDIFIKKLTAYGDVNRDPRGRVITVVFMAVIDSEKFNLRATADAMKAEWVNSNEVKKLAFDHNKILIESLAELKFEIQTTNIVAQLLPEKFTLTEMQKLYEIILGRELDKRNFRKKIRALGILQPTRETKMEGAHRPAVLYKFRSRDYKALREKMHVFL